MTSLEQAKEIYRHRYIKTRCVNDLKFFIHYIFKEYYNTQWVHNWHHDRIIELIYAIERREIPNAVVNLPPRYGKTEIIVIIWMVWTIIRNPKAQFLHGAYSDELALKNSSMVRNILKSPCIQRYWGVSMRDSEDAKGLWLTQENGGLKAGGTGGPMTGFGAGITGWQEDEPFDGALILDDPLKPDDARSEAMREAVNERLSGTLHSRRNHSKVPMIIVMQRLHVDDPSGYALLRKIMGDEFYHLKLPAIVDGKPLWEWKHTLEQLEMMQASDPVVFAGQYMQEPYVLGGEVFNLENCRYYTSLPDEKVRLMRVHSWDTAYKAGTHNDPSCCQIWDNVPNLFYLAEEHHGKWEYPELKRRAFELADRDKPDAILIEDKASGQSLIQEFRRETSHPVIAIKPDADKETRARTVAPFFEAGKIMRPEQAGWVAQWEAELTAFPNAKHDDRVDATSQYLKWIQRHGNGQAFDNMLDELGY